MMMVGIDRQQVDNFFLRYFMATLDIMVETRRVESLGIKSLSESSGSLSPKELVYRTTQGNMSGFRGREQQ